MPLQMQKNLTEDEELFILRLSRGKTILSFTIIKMGYFDENNEEWCQVRLNNGKVGYVMRKYLAIDYVRG